MNDIIKTTTRRDILPSKRIINMKNEEEMKEVLLAYLELMEAQNKIFDEINFIKKELIEVVDNQVNIINIGNDR